MRSGAPHEGERQRALLVALRLFTLLSATSMLRPVRDEMGIRFGVGRLPWLFTLTLLAMVVATPLFGALSARLPARRLLPLLDLLGAGTLVALHQALRGPFGETWAAPAFFVWLSVFNLSAVSLTWSFASDLFGREEARRRYGWLAAGGSAGALCGPALAAALAPRLGAEPLLSVGAGCLLLCAALAPATARRDTGAAVSAPPSPLSSGAWSGVRATLGSRYLLGLAATAACYPLLSTLLYLTQAEIVAARVVASAARTALFARLDLAVNFGTLLVQTAVTRSLLRRIGPGGALAAVAILVAGGFGALAWSPGLTTVLALQFAHRVGRFAIGRPARELLFVSLDAESRYPAKQFLDTAIYRGTDAVTAWLQTALRAAGLGIAGIAALAVPISLAWAWGQWRLGCRWERGHLGPAPAPTLAVQTRGVTP